MLSRMIPKSCTVYAEPFCGSAALALNSRKFEVKILNDFNANIANFWRVATDSKTSGVLLKALQNTRYSWSLFEEAKERREVHGAKQFDAVQWAVDTYILNKQSFNGAGENWVYRDAGKYGMDLTNTLKLPLAFRTIQKQSFRVYNTDAVTCMAQEKLLGKPEAFIFLDPPYLEGLRSDSKLYAVDMPDVRDHIGLLKMIQRAKAKIVLSGYWSGMDDGSDLYDFYLIPYGWHRHLLGEYSKSCEGGEERSKGAEWVWTNYDLKAKAPGSLGFLKSYCDDEKSPCLQTWKAVQSPHKERSGENE